MCTSVFSVIWMEEEVEEVCGLPGIQLFVIKLRD